MHIRLGQPRPEEKHQPGAVCETVGQSLDIRNGVLNDNHISLCRVAGQLDKTVFLGDFKGGSDA